MSFVEVLIPTKIERAFSYKLDQGQEAAIGNFVEVDFAGRHTIGVICNISQKPPESLEQAKIKTAKLLDKLPALPSSLLEFIEKTSKYNLMSLGQALALVFSPKLLAEIIKHYDKVIASEKALFEDTGNQFPPLNEEQQAIYQKIAGQELDKHSVHLIFGITGSGKTEIYFYLIRQALCGGDGQVLFLLPEIALTSQIIDRFEQRFGSKPVIWHSALTPKQRREAWWQIASGKARLIIGARSAIFLPYPKLKMVIIDEEHDQSFKQDQGACYQGRDLAIWRARLENIPIILGSATPSLEMLALCNEGKAQLYKLENRFGLSVLPEIKLIDLRAKKDLQGLENRALKDIRWLSPSLIREMQQTLQGGKQVLLFLNRRGYAPIMFCADCGYSFKCADCSVGLVSYKSDTAIKCHHCGYSEPWPECCPECESDQLIPFGPGVERVEEEVKKLFPEARIAIFTRDTTANLSETKDLIEQIQTGEIDVIIGTQIITKGYHFPKLKLVGVVDSDLSLLGGDLRAGEKTFQLLQQVSGRAGREEEQGKALIQSFAPDNNIIKALLANDYLAFANYELAERKEGNWPPFGRLAAIILTGPDFAMLDHFARSLLDKAPAQPGLQIYGPIIPPISQLRKQFRLRFLLKASKSFNLSAYIKFWLSEIKQPGSVRVQVDIDPYNFS